MDNNKVLPSEKEVMEAIDYTTELKKYLPD